MPRVKLLILLILSLTALCLGFASLSSTNADQARQESDMRLNMGERTLRTIETFNGRMRVEALNQALSSQDPALQTSIETMLRFGLDTSAAKTVLQRLRGQLNAASERLTGDTFDAEDLILIQTDQGLLWEEPADEGSAGERKRHILPPAQIAASEFGSLEDISFEDQRSTGRYIQLNGRLYHMNAVSRTVTVKVQEAPSEGDEAQAAPAAETRHKFFAAAAKRLTDQSMKFLAGKAGAEASVVVDGLTRISSLEDENHRGRIQRLQMRNEGVNLDRFPSLQWLPIRFPIQLSGRAHTHQARVIELAGIGQGNFVLTTPTDGLMILAAQQRTFVIGLLIFIAVGAFFVFWVGTGLDADGRRRTDEEPRLRHVPVAGQHLPSNLPQPKKPRAETSKAVVPPTAVPQAAPPVPSATPAPTPAPFLDAPLTIPEAAKLSPDGFDFGDSPLASELSPLPADPNSHEPQAASAPESEDTAVPTPHSDAGDDGADADFAAPLPDDTDSADSASEPAPAEMPAPAFADDAAASSESGLDSMLFDESSVTPEEENDAPGAAGTPLPVPHHEAIPETPAENDIFEGMEEEADALLDSLLPDDPFSGAPQAADSGSFEPEYAPADKTRQINLAALSELQAAAAGLDDARPAGGDFMGDPDEAHFNETYENFVALRIQCGEEGTPDYGQFMDKLRRNRDQVMEKYACSGVRFQAYVKDGKAALKATPIR